MPHGLGTCDLDSRTRALNDKCCGESARYCTLGRPNQCDMDCATVVLPFFEDCSATLGTHTSDFDDIVSLCRAALDVGNGRRLQSMTTALPRRLQMGGDHLHHTTDTHAVCGLGLTAAGCTVAGQTTRQTRLTVGRDDLEAQAAVLWNQSNTSDSHAPNLNEMLISGTPGNALLARMFIEQQQPQVAFPTSIVLNDTRGGGHRRMQADGDHLSATIDTHAATPTEAEQIVQRLIPPGATLLKDDSSSTCNTQLVLSCANARKASVGECLVCANKRIGCLPQQLDDFCRGL